MPDLFSGSDGSPQGGDGEAGSMRSTTARAACGTGHMSPCTAFICFLLERDRTRLEAGKESRRLKLKDEVGRFYFEHVRRR